MACGADRILGSTPAALLVFLIFLVLTKRECDKVRNTSTSIAYRGVNVAALRPIKSNRWGLYSTSSFSAPPRWVVRSSVNPDDSELLERLSARKVKVTISELKDELRARGLKVTGKKDELIARLKSAITGEPIPTPPDPFLVAREAEEKRMKQQQELQQYQQKPEMDFQDSNLPTYADDNPNYNGRGDPYAPYDGSFFGDSTQPMTLAELQREAEQMMAFPEDDSAVIPDHLWDDSDEEDGGGEAAEEGGVVQKVETGGGALNMQKSHALEEIKNMLSELDRKYEESGAEVEKSFTYGPGRDEKDHIGKKLDTGAEMWLAYYRRFGEQKENETWPSSAALSRDLSDRWKDASGMPTDYGLTFEEIDEILYGEEEAHLTPEQRKLRMERRREIGKMEDWYREQMLAPHLRADREEQKALEEKLSLDRNFDRNKGDWYDHDVSIPRLKSMKPTKASHVNFGSSDVPTPAVFVVYNRTQDPVYIGMTFNFNATVEVLRNRRPSQMQWIRYYIIPKFRNDELTLGPLQTVKQGWEEQFGGPLDGNRVEEEKLKWEREPPRAEPDMEDIQPSIGA
eukprot:jgi/Bigna1/91220/estExt_fgenesh1_pg.C_930030